MVQSSCLELADSAWQVSLFHVVEPAKSDQHCYTVKKYGRGVSQAFERRNNSPSPSPPVDVVYHLSYDDCLED